MLTIHYQTSSVVRREEEKIIDFSAYLPERRSAEPVCRPIVWDAARPARRGPRQKAAVNHVVELWATLALLVAALTVPMCLFLL